MASKKPPRAKDDPKPAGNLLGEAAFRKLCRDVKTLVDAAETAASGEKLRAYWEIGRRIVDEKLESRAGYHNSVLRDLSVVSGLAVRTLQETVLFREAYGRAPAKTTLTWSHYRLLSRLSKTDRETFERRAIEGSWSARELSRALLDDDETESAALPRPTGAGHVYRARLLAVVDGDTVDLDLDLGFQAWTKRRVRLARIDAPESGSPEARAATKFLLETLSGEKTLVAKSEKTDAYGRFLVHLFVARGDAPLDAVFAEGLYVNALLLDRGHATRV